MTVLRNMSTCAPKTHEMIENSVFRLFSIRSEEVVNDGVEEHAHLRAAGGRLGINIQRLY